jgi:hypothetical protein
MGTKEPPYTLAAHKTPFSILDSHKSITSNSTVVCERQANYYYFFA